jgi:helicase
MKKLKENEIIEKVLKVNKFKSLNPVQKEAIKMGILDGESLVVSSPTSSGKTLLAEIAGLKTFKNRKKMVYLCPLVALAREKYDDFKEKYEKFGLKIALSVGNYDSADPWLSKYDWIICSNEKFDSLIRHEANWISEIGLIVADEIHLINDESRGPTLEILLTILKRILPKAQILALSATIKNAEDIGNWLRAKVLKSDFRPVPLFYGIFSKNKIKMFGREDYFLREDLAPEEAIVENTILMKKQLIFFLSTRRNAEALAERLSKLVYHFLDEKEIKELEKISKEIERALPVPTEQCKRLANCVKGGTAFYHSGLLISQREKIEKAYKKGLIKVITSTPALAFGINLPNFRAVVRDVKRYIPGFGSVFLPVLEVQQMFGRSGRPQYDKWGEGILIAKSKQDESDLEEFYIKGEIEEISSKISNFSSLRMHSLSLISNRFSKTKIELINFLKGTFFGSKHEDFSLIEDEIERIIFLLEKWNFIKTKEVKENGGVIDKKLAPTILGKRVSQLYIDPLSANLLIEGLKNFKVANDFTILTLLAKTTELKPSPNLSAKDLIFVEEMIFKNEENFPFSIPDQFDEDYEEFLREAKMALIFLNWMEEKSEGEIFDNFKMTPGELHSRLEISDWLFYSILEIGKILNFEKELMKKIRKMRMRLYYGVKEELLNLVKLRGIGRIRARILFDSGFKNIKKLKKAKVEEIAKVLKSKALAEKIKKQIE